MLVELSKHLFGVHVVKLDCPVVGDTSKRLLEQVAELHLVDGSRVGLLALDLRVFGKDFGLGEFEAFDLVEHVFGVVEVNGAALIGGC